MIIWPAKDPDTVADFVWNPRLDAGDEIASITVAVAEGAVVIDSSDHDETLATLWLSGGTDGETCLISLLAITDDGREFADTAAIQIVAKSDETLAAFRLRYPAFVNVPDEAIDYWIADAARVVDTSWVEGDISPAKFAHAAHMMAETGVLSGKIPAGVTSFKSGTFSATIAESIASAEGYRSTVYGRQFLVLRRANLSGPRGAWNPPADVG
jgi:hypothetical protein